jgi:hypothetical protein
MSTCHFFLENMNVLITNSQLKKIGLKKIHYEQCYYGLIILIENGQF